MAEQLTVTYRDYSEELSNIRLRVPTISAANFDAQKVLRDDLVTAISDVTLGTLAKQAVAIIDNEASGAPAVATAQRELKWLVRYRGTDNTIYNAELPCPDVTDTTLFAGGTDMWDPADAKWVTFVTEFEAVVEDQDSGAVVVLDVRLVGRNN